MSITLEAIKEKQDELAKMIAQFQKQPAPVTFPLTIDVPFLCDGERYIGLVVSADGSKRHHIILLPGSVEDKTWSEAMDWAKSIGGELPDRVEGALLYATMKDEFKPQWYWTREEFASDSGSAWGQYFVNGFQDFSAKVNELQARAVRRLPIE